MYSTVLFFWDAAASAVQHLLQDRVLEQLPLLFAVPVRIHGATTSNGRKPAVPVQIRCAITETSLDQTLCYLFTAYGAAASPWRHHLALPRALLGCLGVSLVLGPGWRQDQRAFPW